MNIDRNYASIEQITGTYLNNRNVKNDLPGVEKNRLFEQILKEKRESVSDTPELKFSKHAGIRLEQRNIYLSEAQLKRLSDGTKKAYEKGIKESLMIMDDMAFIVNVKNNTVITAMDQTENSENVFTNIDGAVIV